MAEILGIHHKYFAMPALAAAAGIAAYTLYRYSSSQPHALPSTVGSDLYESDKLLSEYLVFHFGTQEQLIPYPFGPKDALDFPKKCAELCLRHFKTQEGSHTRALDIGCAVGRSTFEMARKLDEVIGIDYSHAFIDAANKLKTEGRMDYEIVQEGDIFTPAVAEVSKDIDRSRVSFEQGDACNLRSGLGNFDVILAANLICRLHHPKDFLKKITSLMVKPGSILVITAPYTWSRDYADKSVWLGGYRDAAGQSVTGFETLKKELGRHFDLVEDVNIQMFIRETARKNQWTVVHATVWRRNSVLN